MQALITLHILHSVEDEEEAASIALRFEAASREGATRALREAYDSDPDMLRSDTPFEDIQEEVDKLVRFLPAMVTILPEGVNA